MKRSMIKKGTAVLTAAALLNQLVVTAALAATFPATVSEPMLTYATTAGTAGAALQGNLPATQTAMTTAQKIALLRTKVKYVFVLFQENRSFDHYFGTYPGANGLYATYPGASATDVYAQPGTAFASFNSIIANTDGTYSTISPFLATRTVLNQAGATVQLFPESFYSVDHSHGGYINDFHQDTNWVAANDGYPLDQQGLHFSTPGVSTSATVVNASGLAPTTFPTLQQKQKAEAVMAHVDCDTIPFLWHYADVGVLFDNFHQSATGPSTPNAIAMIAAQVGDTQWVKHPAQANVSNLALPVLTDTHPFPGSTQDTTGAFKPPYGPDDGSFTLTGTTPTACCTGAATQMGGLNGNPLVYQPLTFASLPLSFMGHNIASIIKADQNPAVDLADVSQDITKIALSNPVVNWGWYQQGYGVEPFDNTATKMGANTTTAAGIAATPEHTSYIVHHNGPQYFGYIGDNPTAAANMHSLGDFYNDVAAHNLPSAGGVFFVRGGYFNNDGLTPADPNPAVKASFPGNDDHGSYSDSQISEALVADSINAIATATDAQGNSIWNQSAIVITYDESDGFFDHQPEQFRTYGPDGKPETGGPRIPAIILSPYAAAHTVSHQYSEHSSVIKFINELFNLTPLAKLPNEAAAMTAGATNTAFNGPTSSTGVAIGPQTYLGPADNIAGMGDLLEAFDNDRLTGKAPLLAAPTIDPLVVKTLPHTNVAVSSSTFYGCQNLNITPTDYPNGYATGAESFPPPLDFNPRPTVSNGSPYYNTSSNTTVCSSASTAAQLAVCAQGATTVAAPVWPN